jgi:hypothetical protein
MTASHPRQIRLSLATTTIIMALCSADYRENIIAKSF